MADPDAREPPPSYHAILRAAVAEFAERGRDGVRMERVAERAGLNKSLVYRHFHDRDRLYDAALESVFSERFELLDDLPRDLGKLFDIWTKRFASDDTFLTMLLREAIESGRDEPVHADLRRRYYKRQIALILDLQAEGNLPGGMAPEHLFLMLMAILVFPYALPQVSFLVTGQQPSSAEFREAWMKLFTEFTDQLGAHRDTPSSASPRPDNE